MRVESMASRLEFNERRARALESAVVYKPASEERPPGGRRASRDADAARAQSGATTAAGHPAERAAGAPLPHRTPVARSAPERAPAADACTEPGGTVKGPGSAAAGGAAAEAAAAAARQPPSWETGSGGADQSAARPGDGEDSAIDTAPN